MTNEKILELLNEINLEDRWERDASVLALVELRRGVKQNIMDENNKRNGRNNISKIVKEIMKNAEKVSPGNKALSATWISEEKMYVCDGHRVLCLNTPIDAPMIPDDCNPINVKNMFKRDDDIEIEVPSVSEIKGNIKIIKSSKVKGMRGYIATVIGNDEIHVHINATYLEEILEALGEDCRVFVDRKNYKFSPIYLESEIGSAIILPVKQEDERKLGEYWAA